MKERIVDIIFERSVTAKKRETFSLALAIAIVLHGGLLVFAARSEPSLQAWSASVALQVHDELQNEDIVTLEPEKPPPKEIEEAPRTLAPRSDAPSPATPTAAPAAAEAVMTHDAPLDLTSDTIVSGEARVSPGGPSASSGTRTAPAAKDAQPAVADRSRTVTLESDDWSCAWPSTAQGEVVDEQKVVIKVEVGADGRVINAAIVRDEKGGFGDAALACARRTRFVPARDRDGQPLRAWSPPIEVRFERR